MVTLGLATHDNWNMCRSMDLEYGVKVVKVHTFTHQYSKVMDTIKLDGFI
jgi:hypothetical protein